MIPDSKIETSNLFWHLSTKSPHCHQKEHNLFRPQSQLHSNQQQNPNIFLKLLTIKLINMLNTQFKCNNAIRF